MRLMRGGARFDEALAGAVHHQPGLLLDALDRHEAHVRAAARPRRSPPRRPRRSCRACRSCGTGATNLGAISRTVWPCAANSRAQWCAPEHASMPIVHGGSEAISSCSLARGNARAHQLGLARLIHAVHGEDVLGEIDANVQNGHGLPLPSELMRVRTSHRGTSLPVAATAASSGRGSPFHSLGAAEPSRSATRAVTETAPPSGLDVLGWRVHCVGNIATTCGQGRVAASAQPVLLSLAPVLGRVLRWRSRSSRGGGSGSAQVASSWGCERTP